MAKPAVTPPPQSYYEQDPNSKGQYRVIPGAGQYLESQNKAQSAYDRSVAQLKATRAKQQISSGLGTDWQVDPHAQYGAYQSLIQQQGARLDQQQEQNQGRGFFGAGLGNQGLSAINYGNALESLGFKNQLSDWENQYQNSMADALRQKNAEMLGSLQQAADDGYGDWTPGDYPNDPNPYPNNPTGPISTAPRYGTPPHQTRPGNKGDGYVPYVQPKPKPRNTRPPEGAPARGGGRR